MARPAKKTTKAKAMKKVTKTKETNSTKAIKVMATKQTKSEIINAISEQSDFSRKQVNLFFEALHNLMVGHIKKGGSGEFTIPYLGVRIMRKTRPAMPKRQGRNPATGETIMIKAKPASTVIKLKALKALKDSV